MNLLLVVGLALLLSLSRSAWLGAAAGAAIVAAGTRQAVRRWSAAAAVAGMVVAVLVVAGLAGRSLGVEFQLERDVGSRVLTLVNPNQWGASRLHIWQDSLTLIASRPVIGYGPDNFGLVFPRFETGDWGVTNTGFHQQIDKAHAETLQVAATQGILGLAAYLSILVAFARPLWGWRHLPSAAAVFAAFVAYQATIQLGEGSPWQVIDVDAAAVYAVTGSSGGLWRLPFSGTATQIVSTGFWQGVGGGFAYGTATSQVPQGVGNTILRLDLRTGSTTDYFTIQGQQSGVQGFDGAGNPIIYVSGQNLFDIYIATSPFSATRIASLFGSNFYPSGPPIPDRHGLWFASGNGIVLHVQGVGWYRMSGIGGQLAGGCY